MNDSAASNVTCPICRESNAELDDSALSIWRCPGCSHVFTSIPDSEQEPYSDRYFLEKHKNWFQNPDTKLFARVARELDLVRSSGKRVLDVGCGRGDLLRFLASHGVEADLVGIDLVENSDPKIRFVAVDFVRHEFGEKFHFVVSTMVIEHVGDPIAFAERLRGVLEPGGKLAVNTINSGAIMHRVARFLRRLGFRAAYDRLYDHHHLQHYTVGSLRRLLSDAGFEVLSHRTHNFPLKAVDLPDGSALVRGMHMVAVALIFWFSSTLGGGLCQTVICRKR